MSAETAAGWRSDYPHILLSPMRLKSPLRPQSLAEVFTKYCTCKDSDCPSCSSSHHRGTPRGTPRTALSELKTDSNNSPSSSKPRSARSNSSHPSAEVTTPLRLRSSSISPSTKPASPLSCSTPNGFSSRSRGLVRTKSGKRSFSQSGSPLPHAERRRLEFKENQVVEKVAECSSSGGEGDRTVSPFKRKRPPKLQIPCSSESEVNANAPKVSSSRNVPLEVSAEGTCYGMYSKKGHRDVLEDTFQAVPDMDGQAFFGIFDGHGGRVAAEYAADNLSKNIREALNSGEGDLESAVRLGYLATDAGFLEKQVSSGASCVTAFVKDGTLVVANAGDCRAVICRGGVAEALTQDHRLAREDERRRVEKLGAYVDCFSGVWRLQGTLAVSRGIGDLHLKEWVSAEPEIQRLEIDSECEFLILASDGLWDVISNQEAVDCIAAGIRSSGKCGGLASLSKKVAQLAASRGSQDDISVMVINLRQFFN